MKKLAAVIAVAGVIGTPAFAVDMAVKAPPAPAPAPVYNWTGWYVGVNAGASMGNVNTDFNVAPVTVTVASPRITNSVTTPDFGFSNREAPSGFIGGGQIGYNWQVSPIWVVGLEADFQGALEKDTNNLSNPFTFTDLPVIPGGGTATVTGTVVTNYTTKIDWFGTVRGRIGYVWGNGDVLSYLTGGLAYGKVDIEGTSTASGTVDAVSFSATKSIGHSHVNVGWVLGYGTEGRLTGMPGWTWKVEGLYMDFGSINDSDDSLICTDCTVTVTGGQVTTHTHFTDGILRGGLNYKFN